MGEFSNDTLTSEERINIAIDYLIYSKFYKLPLKFALEIKKADIIKEHVGDYSEEKMGELDYFLNDIEQAIIKHN